MKFKDIFIVFIYNIIVAAIWAGLAVFFNAWWIALFGIFVYKYSEHYSSSL